MERSPAITALVLLASCASRAPVEPPPAPPPSPPPASAPALPWPLQRDERGQTGVVLPDDAGGSPWVTVHVSSVPRLLDSAGCLAANLEVPTIIWEYDCSQVRAPGPDACVTARRFSITVRVDDFPNAGRLDELDAREQAARQELLAMVGEARKDAERVNARGMVLLPPQSQECLSPCDDTYANGPRSVEYWGAANHDERFWRRVLAPGCPTPMELRLGVP